MANAWDETTWQSGGDAAPAGRLRLVVVRGDVSETHALPPVGDLTVGRSRDVDVRVDDPAISRRHFVLHLGPTIRVEDLGSKNGLRVRGERVAPGASVTLQPGDVLEAESVVFVLQRQPAARARARRVGDHAYFEGRVDEECARAERRGGAFALVRVRGAAAERLLGALGGDDVVAAYGPDDYEILWPEVAADEAQARAGRLAAAVGEARTGVALFPRDGRSAEALLAVANARLRPVGRDEDGLVVDEAGSMGQLWSLLRRVAKSALPVLLVGETGVGKERFAEAIHRASPRAHKPLLRLNCAGFSEALLESELFGHDKGAFTGAGSAKAGLLETADGGTVFLDEVGELLPALQAKLLRVLEDKKVRRVGGLRDLAVDVRFVSATNRDLDALVADGRFRQDLYFRLNAVPLVIPPLRERRGEIEPLARAFLQRAADELGVPAPALSDAALRHLVGYAWPGNIRELRNVVERAVVLCGDGPIDVEHLPVEKMRTLPPPSAPAPADERQRIVDALERAGGNQTLAARALGISRGTLVKRLEAYAIRRPRKQ